MSNRQPEISILISSYKRKDLLKRTLFSIATNAPSKPFEVILANECSDQDEDLIKLVRTFSSQFVWKFINVDVLEFEEKTGVKKFFNNSTLTTNIAFKNTSPSSKFIFLQGNECIAGKGVYDTMVKESPTNNEPYLIFSTTYELPQSVLDQCGSFGQHITAGHLETSKKFPLQTIEYRSDVNNYISLSSRETWEKIGLLDERYMAGIACEDSDFVRRIRALAGAKVFVIPEALSLHQFHNGKNIHHEADPNVITKDRWNEGLAINRKIYDSWNGKPGNSQTWEPGIFGVKEVLTNEV